jgi:hypothetical protein
MKKAADANEAMGMAELKLVQLKANHLLLSEATALASGDAVPVVGPAQCVRGRPVHYEQTVREEDAASVCAYTGTL